MTRDVHEQDFIHPEDLHPYAYARSNPYVFRDREGEVSLSELNVSQLVDRILTNLPRVAQRAVIRYIRDTAETYVSDALFRVIEQAAEAVLSAIAGGEAGGAGTQGTVFEDALELDICAVLPSSSLAWYAVPISGTGRARGNGTQCSSGAVGPARLIRTIGFASHVVSFPDAILSEIPPSRASGGNRRTYLITEFKLSTASVLHDPQFTRIVRHAQSYAWADVALWLTLWGNTAEEAQIAERALAVSEANVGRPVLGAAVWARTRSGT